MDKVLALFGVISIALIALLGGIIVTTAPAADEAPMYGVPPAPGNPVIPNDPTTTDGIHNEALSLAKLTTMNDSTFKFDGMDDTLKVAMDDSGVPIVAIVEFTSRHAGFGDRSDMMTAEVLTPHTCIIKISQGQVIYAVMDGQWDMLTQKVLKS